LSPEAPARPAWVAPTTLAIAVAGFAVAGYLTIAHFVSPRILACGTGGVIDCEKVTSGPGSTLFGIPVGIPGMLWFGAMAVLTSPPAWRAGWVVAVTRLAASAAGVAFVLYLLYMELFVAGALCSWCTVVHLLAFAMFVILALYAWPDPSER
jgi:uncharacterized membrane protein